MTSIPASPPFPRPSRTLSLPGFSLGHGTDRDGMTGVTVVLCPRGGLAAAEVRGPATRTRQFDSLVSGQHVASRAGPTVAAAVAVNAFGDVRDRATGRTVAGCRRATDSRELAGAERVLAALPPEAVHPWEGNTTLAVVMTDAALSKAAALKVC